jgi:hypothetical protein
MPTSTCTTRRKYAKRPKADAMATTAPNPVYSLALGLRLLSIS